MKLLKKRVTRVTQSIIMLVVLISTAVVAADLSAAEEALLQRKVREKLASLASYGAFDVIGYTVDGKRLVLYGAVSRPHLKYEAERLVRRVDAFEEVDNQLEILPISSQDDEIRVRTYRAIYGDQTLRRYAPGGGESRFDRARFRGELHFGVHSISQIKGPHAIHIIVKNGHVTLIGQVRSGMDRDIAGVRANQIPGVFSVTNNLQVG